MNPNRNEDDTTMNQLAIKLDAKLHQLGPTAARDLEARLHDTLNESEKDRTITTPIEWPTNYFRETAGTLADKPFERPDQGTHSTREDW